MLEVWEGTVSWGGEIENVEERKRRLKSRDSQYYKQMRKHLEIERIRKGIYSYFTDLEKLKNLRSILPEKVHIRFTILARKTSPKNLRIIEGEFILSLRKRRKTKIDTASTRKTWSI